MIREPEKAPWWEGTRVRKVYFRVDRSEYVGETIHEIIDQLRQDSHDRAEDEASYMKAVARRAAQVYGRALRTDSAIHFLRDLEKLGEGRLVKEVL